MDDHLKAAADAVAMTDATLLAEWRKIDFSSPLSPRHQAILDEINLRDLDLTLMKDSPL